MWYNCTTLPLVKLYKVRKCHGTECLMLLDIKLLMAKQIILGNMWKQDKICHLTEPCKTNYSEVLVFQVFTGWHVFWPGINACHPWAVARASRGFINLKRVSLSRNKLPTMLQSNRGIVRTWNGNSWSQLPRAVIRYSRKRTSGVEGLNFGRDTFSWPDATMLAEAASSKVLPSV